VSVKFAAFRLFVVSDGRGVDGTGFAPNVGVPSLLVKSTSSVYSLKTFLEDILDGEDFGDVEHSKIPLLILRF
jgi:hypothetical protein